MIPCASSRTSGAMPISMELPVFSTLRVPLFSRLALVPAFGIPFSSFGVSSDATARLKCNARKARRICVTCLVRDSASMETTCERDEHGGGGGSELIEVVVIGSRKESIMACCLDSPFPSLPLRFWYIFDFCSSYDYVSSTVNRKLTLCLLHS